MNAFLVVFFCLSFSIAQADIYIDNGTRTKGKEFENVVGALMGNTCSGTLIHPSFVLTAAHCLELSNAREAEIHVGHLPNDGVNIPAGERRYKVKRGLTYGNSWTNYDIAILELDKPITHIKPAKLVTSPKEWANLLQTPKVTIVGFGFGDFYDYGLARPSGEFAGGIKRYGETIFRGFSSPYIYLGRWKENTTVPTASSGDSGGPALIGNTLVGVTSGHWNMVDFPESVRYNLPHLYLCWLEKYTAVKWQHSFDCSDRNQQFDPDFLTKEYLY